MIQLIINNNVLVNVQACHATTSNSIDTGISFFLIVTKKMVTSLVASVLYQCKTEKGYETKISNTP